MNSMDREPQLRTALTIIPARGGSKGIPLKNMAPIGGRPLIELTIQAALDARLPGRICLTTDHAAIREFGLGLGVEAPFLRPAELAQDGSSTLSVIEHAVGWYAEREGFHPDYIVLLQPTCPFRSSHSIIFAYQQIVEQGGYSLFSVNKVSEHPCEYITRDNNGFQYVMPPPKQPGRQHFPKVYFINGAIYITQTSFLERTGTLYDNGALTYVMGRNESLDIDDPEDLAYANWLYGKNYQAREEK